MITQKRKREELQLLRDEAVDAYQNREEFRYDADGDALYQRYKDYYTRNGQRAMQDTMAQATALTGGYGSSYTQNVGRQAYQTYLSGMDDVIPELYQLALDRYQTEGNRLYKTYQNWAQLEQQAARQEQRDREFELEDRKRQDAYNRYLRQQESRSGKTQTTAAVQPDDALGTPKQNTAQGTVDGTSIAEPQYDNENVSTGSIKTMQRLLGLSETGKWTALEQQKAGDLRADAAWQAYQQGKLQSRSRSGMSMEEWDAYKKSASSGTVNTKQTTSAVQNFIAGMVTEDQAAERGNNSTEWKMMVVDRLNRVSMTADEFEQLERYYGLDIPGGTSGAAYTADTSSQKISYAEYREKTAAKKVANLDATVQRYFRDYQAFANSAVYDLQNVNYQNGTYMRDIRVQTAEELRKQADTLASSLRMNEDVISGDYSELLTQISSTKTGIDSIMDAFDGQVKYYSQWETEEEAKKAVWQQKYSGKSYAELRKIIGNLGAGDERDWLLSFAESKKTKADWEKELSYSRAELDYLLQLQTERDRLIEWQAMSSVETPGYVQLKTQWDNYHNQFDGLDDRIDALEKEIWKQERTVKYYDLSQNEDYSEKSRYLGGGTLLQQMVNNPQMVTAWDNAADMVSNHAGLLGVVVDLTYDALTYDNLQHMTNDERADFNYIYATEGKDAAKEYLEYLEYTLNERAMGERNALVSKATQSVPFLSQAVASVLSTPLTLMGGAGLVDAAMQKVGNTVTGKNKPIDYNRDAMSYTQASGTIRRTVAQNIVDATGCIDFDEDDHPWLSRLLNGKSWADVYMLGMGIQDSVAVAALATINPALGKVGTTLLGGAAGTQVMLDAAEKGATDEQAITMGILSAAFEILFEKYELESLLGQGENAWQAFWLQGLSEALGEGATQAANIFADIAVMAEKSDWHKNIQHYLNENPDWDYRQAKKEAFIDAALQVGEASLGGGISGSIMGSAYAKIQSTTDDVRENPTSRSIVQPNAITQTATNQVNTSINPSDVAKSLRSKGVYSRKVDGLAEAIAARLNGQELTRSQRSLLNNELGSPTVQSVISELLQKKAAGVDSVQNRIHDGANLDDGPTNVPNQISQNPTARNVGQLSATVQAANNQVTQAVVNQADVAKSLRSKGIYSKEVDGIAEAIVARLNDQELTRLQRSTLNFALNSSAVRNTISEFINRRKNSTEQPSQNIRENIPSNQTSSDPEKLYQDQISRQRYNGPPKAADFQERHDRLEKTGSTWEYGKMSSDSVKSIEKLANMMYDLGSTKENVNAWLHDQTIRKKIGSEEYPLLLHRGRQNKHITGSHEYIQYAANLAKKGQFGPSRLTIGMEAVEQLVQQYHGTGILLKDKNGEWRGIERITFHPDKIGVAVNNLTGAEADTVVFTIRYSKDGFHIVPDYPSRKGEKAKQ